LPETPDDIRTLIAYTNDRITDLQKSYQVLNDCHHILELKYTRLDTRLETVVKLVQFFIAPGTAALIMIELLKIGGVI
jgi:hypothetical protein